MCGREREKRRGRDRKVEETARCDSFARNGLWKPVSVSELFMLAELISFSGF